MRAQKGYNFEMCMMIDEITNTDFKHLKYKHEAHKGPILADQND